MLAAGCATDRVHREGLEAIDAGHYEEGLAKLEESVKSEPHNITYRLDLKARREAVLQRLNAAADTQRGTGKLDEAEATYHRVLVIEPSNNRAQRGLEGVNADRRHTELLAQAQKDLEQGVPEQADAKVRAVLAEDPGFGAAIALRSKIELARGPVTVVPKLHARDNRPVTLQFRDANTKMVFEVLSRRTGINFLFDKDVKNDGKTTIFVQDVPVEQAIELVLGQNQLARQVLAQNMVLIYPNTAAKQKEYQDQIVKTFYLTNADTKQAQNLLKTVLNAKTLFIDERANEIIIRDTPETVRMAEKLLASLDLPEPEVMLEVEILEITRARLQQLGINYPTSVTLKANPVDGGDTLHLSDVGEQTSETITVSPLAITLDALKQTGVTNILASPRIRARNKEKAKILIGSRVPVITNSVTPISGGESVVTGSVQYLDVGLTLEVEPNVYLDNDVAIKLRLEVSNIVKEVKDPQSGTLAYEIGTRDATTLLRLKDGETQILAGLIQDLDIRSSSHVPGLGDIPGLGNLFGSKHTQTAKTEIVMSLTPRIIRSQPRPANDITEFWYGTEANVRSAPMGAASAASGGDNSAPATATGETDDSGANVLSVPPDTESPPPPTTAQRSAPTLPGAPGVEWNAPGEVAVGQDFDVTLRFAGGDAMKTLRSQIRVDPAILQLASAETGNIIPDSIKAVAVPRINQIAGVLQLVANASAEEPMPGDGDLLVLHFKALKASPGTNISLQLSAIATSGASVPPTQQQPLTIAVTE